MHAHRGKDIACPLTFVTPGLVPGVQLGGASGEDSLLDGHPGPASPARAQAQDKPGHDDGKGRHGPVVVPLACWAGIDGLERGGWNPSRLSRNPP